MSFYAHISKENRIRSYDYIEGFVNGIDWSNWGNGIYTDEAEADFSQRIRDLNDTDFEFLLLHCGYIPDYYGKDSSQETLFSKLTESMVCEWARRIGFTQSFLQKQKSNKEDITIKKEDSIVVCDAKSFRLGRSQAAPNVKDTIKKQAYTTWLNAYPAEQRVGGLTTFPSMHDWKKGGEAYAYYTEGDPAIMLLFYEHMAFMLNQHITADQLVDFLSSYNQIYPESSKDKSVYWNGVHTHLLNDNWNDYWQECYTYIKEKVKHTTELLQGRINGITQEVDAVISTKSYEELKDLAKEAIIEHRCKELNEQIQHIKEFRDL